MDIDSVKFKISKLKEYHDIGSELLLYNKYDKKSKQIINELVDKVIILHGTGDWVSYNLKKAPKSMLISKLNFIIHALLAEEKKKLLELTTKQIEMENKALVDANDINKILSKAIDNKEVKFIGEGEWVKDSAYQVYEYEYEFYALIVYDHQNKWILENSVIKISEGEIKTYI